VTAFTLCFAEGYLVHCSVLALDTQITHLPYVHRAVAVITALVMHIA